MGLLFCFVPCLDNSWLNKLFTYYPPHYYSIFQNMSLFLSSEFFLSHLCTCHFIYFLEPVLPLRIMESIWFLFFLYMRFTFPLNFRHLFLFSFISLLWSESHLVVFDALQPHGLYSPWNSADQNTGVGSFSLLQGIFPTQGSNPGFPHWRPILYQLSHKESIIMSSHKESHYIVTGDKSTPPPNLSFLWVFFSVWGLTSFTRSGNPELFLVQNFLLVFF